MPSPLMWGSEDVVRERLGEGITDLQTSRQSVSFVLPFGPAEAVEQFLVYYGPTNKALNALDENGKAAFRRDLEQHWTTYNRATDGTTDVPSEYLKVVAVRA
jgi:hypothetical protein